MTGVEIRRGWLGEIVSGGMGFMNKVPFLNKGDEGKERPVTCEYSREVYTAQERSVVTACCRGFAGC